MANDVNAKDIGLSAKNILMGVITVAAGATGGSAGAQGAQQLNTGLDGILGMAGVTQEPPPSRLNPERADFAVRQTAIQKQTPEVQSVQVAQAPVQAPVQAPPQTPIYREAVVEQAPQQAPQRAPAIPIGVATELARLGYSDTEIADIAAGRWQPLESGQTRKSAEPQRLAQAEGATQKGAEPKPGAGFEGFNIGSVLGVLKGLGQG